LLTVNQKKKRNNKTALNATHVHTVITLRVLTWFKKKMFPIFHIKIPALCILIYVIMSKYTL